jgi:hypothetical protein
MNPGLTDNWAVAVAACTVNVTGTVTLAGAVLVPVIVTDPVCGPGETPLGFTLTLTTPGVCPLAVTAVSQLPSLDAVTVNLPATVANTEILCTGSDVSPCCALKLNDAGATVNVLLPMLIDTL